MMSSFQTVILPLVVLLCFYKAPTLGVVIDGDCSDTEKCDETKFLYCQKVSTSCLKGTCACKPEYREVSKVCQKYVYLGDSCVVGAEIVQTENGECSGGKVACKSGFTKVSNALCKNALIKLLGEVCDNNVHTCWLYTDLFASEGTCSRDYCGCRSSGQVWTGYACTSEASTKIGDQCGKSSECPTDAHCVSGICQCIAGERHFQGRCYLESDYGTLKEGGTCDFTKKECSMELECSLCRENQPSKYTCNQRPPYSGSPARLANILALFCISIAGRFLL